MSEHGTQGQETPQVSESVTLGLSGLGGLGITIMIVAAGVGVIDPSIDSDLIGFWVVMGLFMLIGAIVAWFFVVQPHKNFDDINQPLVEEHHGDH